MSADTFWAYDSKIDSLDRERKFGTGSSPLQAVKNLYIALKNK